MKGKNMTNYEKLDSYGMRNLAAHLIHLAHLDRLEKILCDLFFISAKCAAGMTMNLIEDFAAVSASFPPTGTDEMETAKLEKIKRFEQFVQSEANQLTKHLQNVPKFCIQQAYNSADSGPVAMEAEKVIHQLTTSRVLLRFRHSLPQFNPKPELLRTIEGYSSGGKSLDITSDGNTVVAGGTDKELKLWDIHSGELNKSLKGETEYIFSASITPNGKRAVTGSIRSVRLWDLEDFKCVREFKGHDDCVMAVAISPDGSTVLSGSWDKTIRLWNAETGKCEKLFSHTFLEAINCLCLTPDGQQVVAGDNNRITFWDMHTGVPLKSYRSVMLEERDELVSTIQIAEGIRPPQELCDETMALSMSIDGKVLISGGHNGIVRVWDTEADKCLKELKGHTDVVGSVAVTPCGKLAVSGSWDKTLKVWNLETGACIKTLVGHSDSISTVAVNAEGTLVISGSEDQLIKVWNIQSGQPLKPDEAHEDEVSTVKMTPDGRFAVSGSNDNTLRIWDMNTGECIHTLEGHWLWVNHVHITPDGRNIVSKGSDDTLKIWDTKSAECIHTIENTCGFGDTFELTPDGEIAIDSDPEGKIIKVLNVSSGECLRNMEGHSESILTMGLSPDGRLLVSGGEDNVLRVWDIQTGHCLNILEGHSEAIYAIKITPDGRLVVSAGVDGTLRIWDLFTGKCLKVLKGHTRAIISAHIEPSGRSILSVGADEILKTWDIRSGECQGTYSGLSGIEIQADILADGKHVIAGGAEETVHIWDMDTRQCLAVLNHHNKIVSLTANNNRVVIGDAVGNVAFYRLYGLEIPYAVTNSVRLWNYKDADWSTQITSTCHWCGFRFPIPKKISAVIQKITGDINLPTDLSPCLGYPDEVWEAPGLLSQCPECKKKLKFNPFIVDFKGKIALNRLL
ncbi:MAG: WD40 repeat domain-containing protein [bacterium]|nr:WD40 repeat domain-containing protein [bacterium]